MAERTLPFVNVAMWSGGYYSTATKGAKDVIDNLFHLVHGLTPIPTYLDEIEDVYVLAAATSFYRPILPAGTLNLGFSATAMHWLCRKPCDLTDHVQAVGAEGAELAAFAEQGRRDWETILLHRAGVRLEQCETHVVPCPFAAEFRQHGDAMRFALEYIPTLRSWTESTFLAALSPNRPLEERQGIIDRYYSAYETLVRENPVGHGMDYVHIYLTIAKTEA